MEYDISTLLPYDREYTYHNCLYQRWQSSGFSYKLKPRPDHGLLYVTAGTICFEYLDGEMIATAGDFIYLPKNCYYEAVILPEYGETKDYLINFDFIAKAVLTMPVKLFHTTKPWYLEFFREMIEQKINDDQRPFWFLGKFHLLLDHICTQVADEESEEKDHLLIKAKRLLSECLEMPVADIAKACGISESGLRIRFQKNFGCSPQRYRMDTKIRKAKLMLESTGMTVAAVAQELQFYDEAYFCKMFRKYTGCSPKSYLRQKTL